MRSPFPGMNPYLEHPELWAEVHNRLAIAIAEAVGPQIRPKYRVAVEKRIYQTVDEKSLLIGIPHVSVAQSLTSSTPTETAVAVVPPPTKPTTVIVPMPEEVRESYLEVREVATGEVVTTIELLSPKNKRKGEGRKAYLTKRLQVLGIFTHLVEIDLLRVGKPMPIISPKIESRYRILVSRCERRFQAELYAFNLTDSNPTFPLPLCEGDPEPIVDLQSILDGVYDRAGFDLAIDYNLDGVPPLTDSEATWVDTLLREQGLRNQ